MESLCPKPILVLFATREGHSRRIAEHIHDLLQARSIPSEVMNAAHLGEAFSLAHYAAAFITASVHLGKHEREMTRFVRQHAAELGQIPSVFLSVSLSEAGAENVDLPAQKRAEAGADAKRMIDEFLQETGWQPGCVRAVAGALPYRKYNFPVRFMMKQIAKKMGGPTDSSRDFEFTDWRSLERLVDELVPSLWS